MAKIKRNFKINYSLDWTYGVSISKIKEDLEAIEKLGATSIEIQAYDDYGSSCVEIYALSNRLETDDECAERIKIENERQEQAKQYELKQLEQLKQKYNQ